MDSIILIVFWNAHFLKSVTKTLKYIIVIDLLILTL